MAKRRRQQHHLGQEASRKRNYAVGGTQPEAKYKPEFPFNLLQNAKVFYVIGAFIMVGGLVVAVLLGGQTVNTAIPDATPIPSPTPEGTPGATATPDPRTFSAAEDVIDAETTTYTATIETSRGTMVVELFADIAPDTVNNFVFLAQKKYFDGLPFHRVVDNFIIQTGDPTGVPGDGRDGPGYQTSEEPSDLLNEEGTIAMAKTQGATVFGSQWFVNLKDNPSLDATGNRFYPFGKLTEGLDVAKQIAQGDVIESVTITEAAR